MMYELFELKKVLTLVKPGGAPGVAVQLSAYSECTGRSILTLVCDNGYILFHYLNGSDIHPVIRQLNWFSGPDKEIKALCFDPSGTCLLLVTFDASVYILPVLSLLDPTIRFHQHWRTDNITEIKLTGQRAPLTSVRWWQTLQNQHIAVIGSELGEIAFVNLINKKEVGGTYITIGISTLDILKDESHDTTYLLITGNNRQQWRLLLEEKKSNFYWPFSSEIEVVTCDRGSGLSTGDSLTKEEEKDGEQKPHKLSKFESGTFLTLQSGIKSNLVSAYNSSSKMLQVLEGDLDQMHLFSYQVPADCDNVVLSDKLIFVTKTCQVQNEKSQSCLKLLSRKFAEICLDNSKKKEQQNSEMQEFLLDDKVIAVYKRSFECSKCANFQNFVSSKGTSVTHSSYVDAEIFSNFNIRCSNRLVSENAGIVSSANCESDSDEDESNGNKKCSALDPLSNISSLDGCYLVLKDTIWECRLRFPPEILFLNLTSIPADLPLAEKLGIMLGLEIHKLYEIAAEIQLSQGQFALAVHLYQLSKCPQLKRIAHFMSYGYLSELIAYIQVLFSTKSVEIVSADKCHFANIALHCFAQQAMEKVHERWAINIAFKKFLRDNVYYDEAVAIKLFAEQGLFDLLYYFSKVRGQHGLVVETLLQTNDLVEAVDNTTYIALVNSGLNSSTSHSNYEEYILCLTSANLLQYLAASPRFLSQHIQHLIQLLPNMKTNQLTKVASLFDLSRILTKLAIRNIASSKQRHRYWSTGSVLSVSNEKNEDPIKNDKDLASEEDLIKFFIFVLLMLCHNSENYCFDIELMSRDVTKSNTQYEETSTFSHNNLSANTPVLPLACGLAHVVYCQNGILFSWGKTANGRLGNGDVAIEYENPSPVNYLIKLQVKVFSASCGALHTIALTDFGVFSWGSSRYGQLGLGEVQRSAHPVVIETLMNETIISVNCGQYHSLALTNSGRVYSWGWGVHGQLGHGSPEDINVPKMIAYLKSKLISSLGAGQGHSVLLTTDGEIYTFGCGMFGQLGTGSVLKQSIPQLVSLPEPIFLMSSGYFHSVVVGHSNTIYTWGCNPQALRLQAQCSRRARQSSSAQNQTNSQYNRIATSPSNNTSSRSSLIQTHLFPSQVDTATICSPVTHISCGSHHSVAITKAGEVYTWGRNMEGQLGNGSRREQKIPAVVTHLKDSKIIYVACGADYTIAIESTGKILGWGKNDSGQVGQKPSECTTNIPTGSSSGRVITIRTNRRMITITQPCRQSLLRPTEITIPMADFSFRDVDSGSFESDYPFSVSSHRPISHGNRITDIKDLSLYDNIPYGPHALHATLKAYHSFCDSGSLLKHCLSFSNFQAAAKICFLQNNFAKAIEYQFMAIIADPNITKMEYSSLALRVVEFYSSHIEAENSETSKFLFHVIKFWTDHDLPVQPLEKLFQNCFHLFSYSLSLLLFRYGSQDAEKSIEDLFLSRLSIKFCLNIITSVVKKIQNGNSHVQILQSLMKISETSSCFHHIYGSDALTAWNDSVPSERLWQETLHNVQKGIINQCSLNLSCMEVDVLAKSLISERLYNQQLCIPINKKDEKKMESNDMIAFTCNHHYTLHAFRGSVVPTFKESMSRLPYMLPSTLKYLLNCYHLEGFIPSACPKCVFAEIKSEM